MKRIADIEVGDVVCGIYYQGYANGGTVHQMRITGMTQDTITARLIHGNSEFAFDNFGDYECLITKHSPTQKFVLFLGTEKEAEEAAHKQEIKENLISEISGLISSEIHKLETSDLKKILKILKGVKNNSNCS